MNYQQLGNKISKLRRESNISQVQLSVDLKISRSILSAFENGKGDISLKKLLLILDYLNKEVKLIEKSPLPTFEQLRDELNNE